MVGPPSFTPGTCAALIYVFGPQVVICHRCRKFVAMPKLEVPYDPCPFRCKACGERGKIKDRADAPAGYAEVTHTAASFMSPKNRWKAVR